MKTDGPEKVAQVLAHQIGVGNWCLDNDLSMRFIQLSLFWQEGTIANVISFTSIPDTNRKSPPISPVRRK